MSRTTKKYRTKLIGACLCLLFIIGAAVVTKVVTQPAFVNGSREGAGKTVPAHVMRVVDGDTMKVSFQEAGKTKEETIRLLLVDTPESVDPEKPVQPYALEASQYAKDMLNGQDVRLEFDVSERDKYGRLLCYLYIGDRMFNELLLENGYARVAYIYPPNVRYVDQFQAIQKKAQQKGIRIWSLENYAQEDGFHERAAEAKPSSVPVTTPTPTPKSPQASYNSCTEAHAAGVYAIRRGEPGYSAKLDRDNDGIACEKLVSGSP